MLTEQATVGRRWTTRFTDRAAAGRVLAKRLSAYGGRTDVRVVALARGGVPVAFEVARVLRAPLDVMVVRKLGVPGHRELAMGAIASGGIRVMNWDVLAETGVSDVEVERVVREEQRELERLECAYRGHSRPLRLGWQDVILIDDGVATGATMRAAVLAARRLGAGRVVVALPLAPADTCDALAGVADDVVCVMTPRPFWSVGTWYDDFSQVSDQEVRDLLNQNGLSINTTR